MKWETLEDAKQRSDMILHLKPSSGCFVEKVWEEGQREVLLLKLFQESQKSRMWLTDGAGLGGKKLLDSEFGLK